MNTLHALPETWPITNNAGLLLGPLFLNGYTSQGGARDDGVNSITELGHWRKNYEKPEGCAMPSSFGNDAI